MSIPAGNLFKFFFPNREHMTNVMIRVVHKYLVALRILYLLYVEFKVLVKINITRSNIH
jgi:hypothetical protein